MDVENQFENPEETKTTSPTFDMNMRNYLNSKEIPIKKITQLRQKTDMGSTLEVVFDLKDTGLTYKTAANLAIYPVN